MAEQVTPIEISYPAMFENVRVYFGSWKYSFCIVLVTPSVKYGWKFPYTSFLPPNSTYTGKKYSHNCLYADLVIDRKYLWGKVYENRFQRVYFFSSLFSREFLKRQNFIFMHKKRKKKKKKIFIEWPYNVNYIRRIFLRFVVIIVKIVFFSPLK